MFLKFMVFWGVRARVRDAISPILRHATLFAAILGLEWLVDFLLKVFLIFGSVPVLDPYCIGVPDCMVTNYVSSRFQLNEITSFFQCS